MSINPQDIINSRLGVGIALFFGRVIPPRIGYPFAYRIADLIAARRSWSLVQAVRANQWIVSRGELSASGLDKAVRRTFRNTAHSIYDLHHFLHDPEQIKRLMYFNPPAQRLIDQSRTGGSGFVVVGIHLGNFDFALQAASLRGMHALVITLTELRGGHLWQFNMRRNVGLEIVPANMGTVRRAIDRLKQGGMVLTGVDRPIGESKYRPRFFGKLSVLPVHHIQMAINARVPVIMVANIRQPDYTYNFLVSEPIHMKPHTDRHREIVYNAEAVLEVAEDFIRQAPEQWSISTPVWPEKMDEVPQ